MSLFSKKSSSDFNDQGDNNGNNKVSLLILLILGGVFAYIYFFTSLIVPHEATVPKTPAPPPEVKQSMPPRLAEQGAPTPMAADAKKPEETKPAPGAVPAAPSAAKPAVPAVPSATKPAVPAVPPVVKPAAPPVPSAAKPAVPAPAPADAKPAPAQQPQSATAKTVPPPAVPAPAAAIKKTAKPTQPATKEEPVKTASAVKKDRKKAAVYTIALGELSVGAEVAAAEAKLEKHGIKPVMKQVVRKGKEMHRLFVSSFNDYDAYSTGLETLKQTTKSAFGIEKNGKYSIYAGSFSSEALAQKEKGRLLSKGVKVTLQKTVLPGTTIKLTAGSYAKKAAADKAASVLAKDGLTVKVTTKGK